MTAPGAGSAAQQGAAAFGDPARVEAAHRAVRADPSIQFDLPWHQPQVNPPPRWLIELFDALARFVKWVGDGWYVLMWIAIAASPVRWDYYRYRAGDLDKRGELEAALEAYEHGERYAPKGETRAGKIREIRRKLGK